MHRRDRVVLAVLAAGAAGLIAYLALPPGRPTGALPVPGVLEVLAPVGLFLGLGLLGLIALVIGHHRR